MSKRKKKRFKEILKYNNWLNPPELTKERAIALARTRSDWNLPPGTFIFNMKEFDNDYQLTYQMQSYNDYVSSIKNDYVDIEYFVTNIEREQNYLKHGQIVLSKLFPDLTLPPMNKLKIPYRITACEFNNNINVLLRAGEEGSMNLNNIQILQDDYVIINGIVRPHQEQVDIYFQSPVFNDKDHRLEIENVFRRLYTEIWNKYKLGVDFHNISINTLSNKYFIEIFQSTLQYIYNYIEGTKEIFNCKYMRYIFLIFHILQTMNTNAVKYINKETRIIVLPDLNEPIVVDNSYRGKIYKTVSIHLGHKTIINEPVIYENRQNVERSTRRAHSVRAYVRWYNPVLRDPITGIKYKGSEKVKTFVRPHERGNIDRGEVIKDYKIDKKPITIKRRIDLTKKKEIN